LQLSQEATGWPGNKTIRHFGDNSAITLLAEFFRLSIVGQRGGTEILFLDFGGEFARLKGFEMVPKYCDTTGSQSLLAD